jgi:site-specific recombinase XerD
MQPVALLDRAGRRRSPATLASFHQGRSPRNKGVRYPPDPPTVERSAGDDPDGARLRGVVIILWRARLRISEALALAETDLDPRRGAALCSCAVARAANAGVGMDRWAWEQLEPWLAVRAGLPVGALFCILRGLTRGRPCTAAGIRVQLRNAATQAGVRRRFAPHQLRHAHAGGDVAGGVPLLVIQRQLGHADLGITSAYLRGIDNTEIIHTVHERPVPVIPAASRLARDR